MERKSPERMAPPPEIVLLDDLITEIRVLTGVIKSTIPRGERLSFIKNITDQLIDVKQSYPLPWFSISLINYGPDSVFLGVNKLPELDSVHGDELKINEITEIDMKSASIKVINCRCLKGQNATLRVRGLY